MVCSKGETIYEFIFMSEQYLYMYYYYPVISIFELAFVVLEAITAAYKLSKVSSNPQVKFLSPFGDVSVLIS